MKRIVKIKKRQVRAWIPVMGQFAVICIGALALLWPVLFRSDLLFAMWKDSDLLASHWPMAFLLQSTFAQTHRLPLWNPSFGGGLPLGANPLAALFYPPTQLVNFFSLRNYFLVLILGHLVWAGLGMLLLAGRVAGLRRLPALVAAVSYMATPKLLAHLGAGHITMVQTVAWYPWLALTSLATLREPRRYGPWLALCIALLLLAGHPQMAYYGLLMVAAMVAWFLARRWRQEGWRTLRAPLAGLVAAGIVGLLLAAIHLLPLLELTTHSTRQSSLHSGDAFPLFSFLSSLLAQPPPGSPWETLASPGLIVLGLALLAVITRWHRVWPLGLGIVLVIGLALGNASPLYLVVAHVLPDMGSFRAPLRIWFIALVAVSLLAGYGTDALIQGMRWILARVQAGGAARKILSVGVGCLVLLIVGGTLVTMDTGYLQVGNVSLATTPTRLAQEAARLAGSGKIYGEQENILQACAAELNARLADGQDPLLIESYVTYMQRAGGYIHTGYALRIPYDAPTIQPHAALLGLMNVSIVLSRRPLTDPRLVFVEQVDGTLLYRNTADAGPAYLVQTGPNGDLPSLDHVQRLPDAIHTNILAHEQSSFTFTTGTTAYIVLATTAFPGWTATLDGQTVPVKLFAGVMPAVQVGPGTHTLTYSYHPTSVRIGALLSLGGLLALLAWLLMVRFWRAHSPRKPSEPEAIFPVNNPAKPPQETPGCNPISLLSIAKVILRWHQRRTGQSAINPLPARLSQEISWKLFYVEAFYVNTQAIKRSSEHHAFRTPRHALRYRPGLAWRLDRLRAGFSGLYSTHCHSSESDA